MTKALNRARTKTIDQVKIFGSYARFNADLAPPGDGAPARVCATTAATALRYLRGTNPGPVHFELRIVSRTSRNRSASTGARGRRTQGFGELEASSTQFTIGNSSSSTLLDGDAWRAALTRIVGAKRGLLVVGGSSAVDSIAAASIAKTLGWAVAADATSGMRVGASARDDVRVVSMIDYVLVEPKAHDALRPDVVLQVGLATHVGDCVVLGGERHRPRRGVDRR